MKSRRGISEMIAVILILVIVSVAGAALYRTSLVALGSEFTSYTHQANDQTLAAQERFEVVNIEKSDSSNTNATIYILNYSPINTIDVSIDKVYIDDTPTTIVTGNSPGLILKDVVLPIKVTSKTNFQSGVTYKFEVVSQRGTANDFKWKCP